MKQCFTVLPHLMRYFHAAVIVFFVKHSFHTPVSLIFHYLFSYYNNYCTKKRFFLLFAAFLGAFWVYFATEFLCFWALFRQLVFSNY
jgi:ATP/ADP translocase